MNPVFFPFTFISESALAGVRRFFKDLTLIQATRDTIPDCLKGWQAQGWLHIRVPQAGDADIGAMLRDYRTWAQYRQGGDISVYKYVQDRIPFFNDASVSQIKKEIRGAGGGADNPPAGREPDWLLQARLFLQMAQEFDEQSLDIARSLKGLDRMEQGLFESLRGEGEDSAVFEAIRSVPKSEDPFAYMLADRLGAWSRVMLSHDTSGDVFITSSRAVLESALEALDENRALVYSQTIAGFSGDAGAMAGRQQALMAYLNRLSNMPASFLQEKAVPPFPEDGQAAGPPLELVTIFNIAPPDFFARFLQKHSAAHTEGVRRQPEKNTILGLVEPD